MNTVCRTIAASFLLLAGSATASVAQDERDATPAAAMQTDHEIVTADEVVWGPGPASIPGGAEAVVLYGDPTAEGLFALRLKLPDGYLIPPHTHPKPEIVTVISGTFRVGMGETANESEAKDLPQGSFFAFPPGMAHYAYAEGETVIQLNSTGPWALDYINPEDDPREASS
jgi:quercetin dioxygenase-like cupin family protein